MTFVRTLHGWQDEGIKGRFCVFVQLPQTRLNTDVSHFSAVPKSSGLYIIRL